MIVLGQPKCTELEALKTCSIWQNSNLNPLNGVRLSQVLHKVGCGHTREIKTRYLVGKQCFHIFWNILKILERREKLNNSNPSSMRRESTFFSVAYPLLFERNLKATTNNSDTAIENKQIFLKCQPNIPSVVNVLPIMLPLEYRFLSGSHIR